MNYSITQKFLFFIFVVSLCFCSSFSYARESITVAVASSYYTKARAYSAAFESRHGVKVKLISGATGRLFNQVRQGAPFDIFIAADKEHPALLNKPNKQIAVGFIGLMRGQQTIPLDQLNDMSIKHVAIPNPQIAPFGKAARHMLVDAGLWQHILPKLVYAQHAMQAAMMVDQGLVDAGFVPVRKKSALATVPYMAVLLSDRPLAQRFYQGLPS